MAIIQEQSEVVIIFHIWLQTVVLTNILRPLIKFLQSSQNESRLKKKKKKGDILHLDWLEET